MVIYAISFKRSFKIIYRNFLFLLISNKYTCAENLILQKKKEERRLKSFIQVEKFFIICWELQDSLNWKVCRNKCRVSNE